MLRPCPHLPIKWTFVHLEWSKIVKNADLAKFILKRMAELDRFLCQVKEYYPLLYYHEVDFKPLCPFVQKVDICSPGMKQICEKIQTKRMFSWRGWPSWVKFLYKVKKCCLLLCCPEVDFQPLSPFPIKWTFVHLEWSKIVKKCWLCEFFLEEDGRAG